MYSLNHLISLCVCRYIINKLISYLHYLYEIRVNNFVMVIFTWYTYVVSSKVWFESRLNVIRINSVDTSLDILLSCSRSYLNFVWYNVYHFINLVNKIQVIPGQFCSHNFMFINCKAICYQNIIITPALGLAIFLSVLYYLNLSLFMLP